MSIAMMALALAVGAPLARPAAAQPSFDVRILTAHNLERERVGVKPLVWSQKLAADAAIWARHLAATNSFDHAPDRAEGDEQGENLWMGTAGAYSPEDMVKSWVDERKIFRLGLFPNVSTTGNWIDVGHYTQLIWYNTTTVGCARVTNHSDDFLVCRYGPPGNWMGESPLGKLPKPPCVGRKCKNKP
jgi:Cysteine-rich secretory protein family